MSEQPGIYICEKCDGAGCAECNKGIDEKLETIARLQERVKELEADIEGYKKDQLEANAMLRQRRRESTGMAVRNIDLTNRVKELEAQLKKFRWKDIGDAPTDGDPIIIFGLHETPIKRTDVGGNEVICDVWQAIAQWDIWRNHHQWVFCKDGEPLWGKPMLFKPLDWPEGDK